MSTTTFQFTLTSHWDPTDGIYRLALHNESPDSVAQFRLGLSGPFRIDADAVIDNGRVVAVLSTFAEIAPLPAFELLPGASWIVDVRVEDAEHRPAQPLGVPRLGGVGIRRRCRRHRSEE